MSRLYQLIVTYVEHTQILNKWMFNDRERDVAHTETAATSRLYQSIVTHLEHIDERKQRHGFIEHSIITHLEDKQILNEWMFNDREWDVAPTETAATSQIYQSIITHLEDKQILNEWMNV